MIPSTPVASILRARRRTWMRPAALGLALAVAAGTASAAGNPVISGSPAKYVKAGSSYAFTPRASDPNGDTLRFSVANKPSWMSFNASTGRLSGTPTSAQAGRTYSGIRISVTDGDTRVYLPSFWITVGGSGGSSNHAPAITGAPVRSATVGSPYAWQPNATDADGDKLTFSITGKPSWASFDTTSGTLHGTPNSSHVGSYANIVIKASDGKATDALPAYTITVSQGNSGDVTLSWSRPTTNTDGTPLDDLAGYTVYYGNSSRSYTASLPVNGASTTSTVVEGLGSGTWYFAVKSRNSDGVASDFSSEVSKTL